MLASATPGDMESLRDDYDVRLVIDLRTDEEAAYGSRSHGAHTGGARLVRLPVFRAPSADGADAREAMRDLGEKLGGGELDIMGLFCGLYPRFVLGKNGIAAYRSLFKELVALEEGAALWHCSAGKDRCGIASMLVETALGVPWDLVEQDYLATNEMIMAKGAARNMFDVGGVDTRYLRAALDAISRASAHSTGISPTRWESTPPPAPSCTRNSSRRNPKPASFEKCRSIACSEEGDVGKALGAEDPRYRLLIVIDRTDLPDRTVH